jgi:hypothetical protein
LQLLALAGAFSQKQSPKQSEDEEKVSSFIKKGLNEHNYEVDIADNGEAAL